LIRLCFGANVYGKKKVIQKQRTSKEEALMGKVVLCSHRGV
jgi:hypothetical protein